MAFQASEPGLLIFVTFLETVDNPVNYLYLLMMAIWSTFYVESWKRKQNGLNYLWGQDERAEDIMSNDRKEQRHAAYVIE